MYTQLHVAHNITARRNNAMPPARTARAASSRSQCASATAHTAPPLPARMSAENVGKVTAKLELLSVGEQLA